MKYKEITSTNKCIILCTSLIFCGCHMHKPPQPPPDKIKIPHLVGNTQHVLFTGKVKNVSVGKLEKFFKEEMISIIAKSDEVLGVETYTNVIGDDFKYIVLLKLKPNVSPSFDTAFQIFSNGRTPEESFATLNNFANFFEAGSPSVILYRPDLSISRGVAGYFEVKKTKF